VAEYAWEPEQVDTSFTMVSLARTIQTNIQDCEAGLDECPVPAAQREAAIEQWSLQLESIESLLISVMDIQSAYGISSWL
jgi:hypothetical protein